MFRSKFLMAAFVAAIAALAGPATSQAAFSVTLMNGATIFDGGVGDESNLGGPGPDGSLGYHQFVDIGSTRYEVEISSDNKSFGPAAFLQGITNTTIKVILVSGTAAPNLQIQIKWDGFSQPTPGGPPLFLNTGVQANTVSSGQADIHTVANGTPTSPVSTDMFVSGNFFSLTGKDSKIVPFAPLGTPYTVTQDFSITLSGVTGAEGAFNVSSHAAISAFPGGNLVGTPAPAGLILAATALPFFGLLRRRLRRAEPTVAA